MQRRGCAHCWMTQSLLGLFIAATPLQAQQDRITGRIENSRMLALEGSVRHEAQPQFDQGPVDPSFKMGYISLLLKSSTEQQLMLNGLLAEQQDPFSPNYHKWITPEEYADRFGLSQNDIDKIAAWVQLQGFAIDYVARSRTFVAFSGTAEQVRNTFQTEIHRYNVDSEIHFANSGEPSIPAALAGIVAGIRGLDDFYPKPPGTKARTAARTFTPPKSPHPEYAGLIGGHYLGPDDLATIYGIRSLYDAGTDGAGQAIVIVGQAKIVSGDPTTVRSTDDVPDLKTFRSTFNLPAANLRLVSVPSSAPSDDTTLGEADLDLEWAGAIARNATLVYVYAADFKFAAQYAIDQNLAPVISMSFGVCEPDLSEAHYWQSVAQQANAQGITWLAGSGDVGPACNEGKKMACAVTNDDLGVTFPASIPEVTAVGGTEFADAAGHYWGADGYAVSYIPETTWNDTVACGLINDIFSTPGILAGGGGLSRRFQKPSWQKGSGYATTPADGYRDVPDVALAASGDHDAYWFCSQGSCGFWGLVFGGGNSHTGGTSASTPVFAGIISLVNQYTGSTGLGNINPILYKLAQSTNDVFHDVQAGDNIVPCSDCTDGHSGSKAGWGYDQVTGLGSVDAFKLANAWIGLPPRPNTTMALRVTPATVAQGGTLNLTATVTATSGTKAPTGTVSFSNMDSSVASICELGPVNLVGSGSSATATATWDTSTSKCANVDALYASYPGDDTFNGSISQLVHVAVTAAKMQTSTTLTASSSQITAGGSLTLQAGVTASTGSGVPTGTVAFYDDTVQLANPKLDSSGKATLTTSSFLPGKHSLAALYNGDSTFASSLSSVVTVTSAAPAITVSSQMVTKSVDTSGCSVPSPTTTFLTSDHAVWMWFNMSGAKAGDVASAIWSAPDGSTYLSGKWDPLASGGGYCFYWNIDVAGYPPATSPGKWSVRVLWNGSSLFKLDFTIQPAATATASMVTKSFDTASCSVPLPATAFLTTDKTAFVWFSVNGADANDVPSVTWYTPGGPVYQSSNWSPVASAGNWCFVSSIDIANNPPVSSPGNWAVRGFWNGSSLFTRTFTILAPNSNTQPQITSLNPSSAVAGSGSTVLSILGSHFLPNSTVTFNSQVRAITGPPDARQLVITLSAPDLAKVGNYQIVVTNPVSGGAPAASNSYNFSTLDPNTPQPAVTSIWTAQRLYAVGDWYAATYSAMTGASSGTFDLMITFVPQASGNTYYYYDDPSDSNEWLHTSPRPVWTGTPQTGQFNTPSFQVTDSVPSGDYHVRAYFSKPGANQPAGAIAETDFSVATNTAAGGCFVATAAFGSPMARQVQWLRAFRDQSLLPARTGRAFVEWYYGWSPQAAAWLTRHSVIRKLARAVLWVPIAFAWFSLRTNAAFALVGILAIVVSLLWSLRRGSSWWRVFCLLILAIGIASASEWRPNPLTATHRRMVVKAAVANDGKVVNAPSDLPGVGRMARVADPQKGSNWACPQTPEATSQTHLQRPAAGSGTSCTPLNRRRRSRSTTR